MNKEKLLLILWFIYTISAGSMAFFLEEEDTFKCFILLCLGAQTLLGFYRVVCSFLNRVLEKFVKVRFKIPPPKRFQNKVTPIYKLVTYPHYTLWSKGDWSVIKYELRWNNFHEYASVLIPFSSLFETYQYENVGSYVFNYDLEGITDIGLLWEERFSAENKEIIEEKTKEEEFTDKVNSLNKIFLENYEKI